MEYTHKVLYQSNRWYNDGLKRAREKDLSGAVISLKKSLQFNRENIAARNLLGLVYYGRGEVGEAVVEWILSKNLQPTENIAGYYLKKLQETPRELEKIKQAIKKYNSSLDSCVRGGKDLAVIQLQKAVEEFPGFLKAYQLLALLYLNSEKFAEAKKALRIAYQIDRTDALTLRYMHFLKKTAGKSVGKGTGRKGERKQTVTYKVGNETIIQPAPSITKDHTGLMTMLNIFIGLIVGVAVMMFLIMPAVRKNTNDKNNRQVEEFGNLIATQEAQISALQKELDGYRAAGEAEEGTEPSAAVTQESYEALMDVYSHYNAGDMSDTDMVAKILTITPDTLGATAREKYDKMWSEVVERRASELYSVAKDEYSVENYTDAVQHLAELMNINSGYDDGNAMNLLKQSYEAVGDEENAKIWADQLTANYPDLVAAETQSEEATE